jgi:hypothetical protein
MKILMMMLFASQAYADCTTQVGQNETTKTTVITTDVPSHLKGATIIVRLANGKETTAPAELFKVVPRKRQEIVLEKTQTVNTVCENEAAQRRNRISVLGGRGPVGGLDISRSGDTVSVQNKVGAIGGLQYQYKLTDRFNVGVQAQTSKTALISGGVDF